MGSDARIDPKERMALLPLIQHSPYDQHQTFWRFSTLVCQGDLVVLRDPGLGNGDAERENLGGSDAHLDTVNESTSFEFTEHSPRADSLWAQQSVHPFQVTTIGCAC